MLEVEFGSILVIAGLLMTFFTYVAVTSYRLGKLEHRVDTNEKLHDEVKEIHASKSDLQNMKEQMNRLENSVDKIFQLMRNESERRYNQHGN